MVNVAILGFGVVGSGTAEVLASNQDIIEKRIGMKLQLKKILDIRDFTGNPFASLITSQADEVFEDDSISVVVETIGGAGIAYEFTKRALAKGKSVVTSNKELVAKHGVELMQLADHNHCAYLFEAAVGGGIPIIRPLRHCLAANEITQITAIVNGTTNYILTQMAENGADFQTSLKSAQEKGYAEQNPSADIDGIDAGRKLAILSTIALLGEYIDPDQIHTEGISAVTPEDIQYARHLDAKVKLLAIFRKDKSGNKRAIVAPHILSRTVPVSVADNVFNAVMVYGNAVGETLFYGQGAGKLATASAVVGDILDAAVHMGRFSDMLAWYHTEDEVLCNYESNPVKALLRIPAKTDISAFLPAGNYRALENIIDGENAFIIGENKTLTESELQTIIANISEINGMIRIY